jgi:5-methylcytosine-specific restriction endonuclease McrA
MWAARRQIHRSLTGRFGATACCAGDKTTRAARESWADAIQWVSKEQGVALTSCHCDGYVHPREDLAEETRRDRGVIGAVAAGGTDESTIAAPTRKHDVLQTKSLVLNRSFLPIHITSVRRACVMLYQGIARAVDGRYQTFDFNGWCQVEPEGERDALGLVGRAMPVPRVVLLIAYDRVPIRHIRFSRFNVYARDRNTCQYCGRRFSRQDLNLDHVIPRSQGGLSTWENIVCSCHSCNRRKGGRTPQQAGIRLLRKPTRPGWTPFMAEAFNLRRYGAWQPFLSLVDAGRENVEMIA